jgi:hypothetical protein
MIENYRSGLFWKLFMSAPEVQGGLKKLGFQSPYLGKIRVKSAKYFGGIGGKQSIIYLVYIADVLK